ncbi:hypothetical protein BF49_4052 [Bradyrhizobium sp.]|nr:hypothetical protein BF49_4052 [Bradyrhizobium sp.]
MDIHYSSGFQTSKLSPRHVLTRAAFLPINRMPAITRSW